MLVKPKDPQPQPRIGLEATLKTFEDLTSLLGATKSLLNTQSEEVNFYRHVSGSFRMKLYAERNNQMRDTIYRFPEYKGKCQSPKAKKKKKGGERKSWANVCRF